VVAATEPPWPWITKQARIDVATTKLEVVDFAMQCNPRLVVAGTRNIRSDDGERAARTVLCVRDQGRTLDVILTYSERDAHDGPTLFETATKLQADGCEEALDLDRGPSTGGVLRTSGSEERVELRGPIRHAIAFTH